MEPLRKLTLAMETDQFYNTLTSRNFHFVSKEAQMKIKDFKILIAGCGSTGGACIEALARLGVCNFYLADNGSYELSNLNRQHARLENLDQNKAQFHAEEVKKINPYASVQYSTKGITKDNVDEYVKNVDLVFDAVDVTTREGIEAKILLHEKSNFYKKPVLTGMDLGYLQWGRSYDYRNTKVKVLDGKANYVLKAKHPISSLFRIFPLSVVPTHCYQLLIDLFENKSDFASQMGCTSDALSAVIVPAVLNLAESKHLISGWSVDLYPYRHTSSHRLKNWFKDIQLKSKIKAYIKNN